MDQANHDAANGSGAIQVKKQNSCSGQWIFRSLGGCECDRRSPRMQHGGIGHLGIEGRLSGAPATAL